MHFRLRAFPLSSSLAAVARVGVAALFLVTSLFLWPLQTAFAATTLTIDIIAWPLVGLDSNDETTGPDRFPLAVRVCNTGAEAATNVVVNLIWDSANVYVNDNGITQLTKASLAVGACADFYFNVIVTRDDAARLTTRQFHVTATADNAPTVSTPNTAGNYRQIHVENLLSQNRNAVTTITGPTTLTIGQTAVYTVTGYTATGGYEQWAGFLFFPNSAFQLRSVRSVYSVPAGATNDKTWADACIWDPNPASANYRSCTGTYDANPAPMCNYVAGPNNCKAGGDPISAVYTVTVLGPAGVFTLPALIYDGSGSSYHYNNDFATSSIVVTITTPTAVSLSEFSTAPRAGNELAALLLAVAGIAAGAMLGVLALASVLRQPAVR